MHSHSAALHAHYALSRYQPVINNSLMWASSQQLYWFRPASLVEREKSGDVWIHFHTSPDDFSSQKLSPLCNFLYEYICNKAPHLHVFSLFFTHFKWSKLGLKQNCEASLSPINQDFLESCQYIAVAYEKYLNHCFFSSQIAVKCRILQGFISISRYRSFLLIYYIFCKKVQNEANHFHL